MPSLTLSRQGRATAARLSGCQAGRGDQGALLVAGEVPLGQVHRQREQRPSHDTGVGGFVAPAATQPVARLTNRATLQSNWWNSTSCLVLAVVVRR